jgi:hypothetical protein
VKQRSLKATEDRTEGHFRARGPKATMNHAEGHQYARGPRPQAVRQWTCVASDMNGGSRPSVRRGNYRFGGDVT